MEQLKNIRIDRGLKQADLAKLLDISISAYGNYELGQREPSIESLKKLAEFYGVSVDFLIGYKPKKIESDWTDEETALGVGRHPVYLSEDELNWLELRSEVLRVRGERYLETLETMIEAVIKQQDKK